MSWLSSFFIGVLTAVIAGVAGGFIAAGCVNWYHAREGESAYFAVEIVLLSASSEYI